MKKQEVPLLDCPKDFLIGDASGKILNEYARFPCKIMCGVYALIVRGSAKATINITNYDFVQNDLLFFEPGNFLLIHEFSEDALVYYIIFSNSFSEKKPVQRTLTDKSGMVNKNAIIHVPTEQAEVLKNMVLLLIQASNCTPSLLTSSIMASVFNLFQVSYNTYLLEHKNFSLLPQDRKELIYQDYCQLVLNHYHEWHFVSQYADKMHLSLPHLSSTIKKVSGQTANELIVNAILTDAKSRLKLTTQSTKEIAFALGFESSTAFNRFFQTYTKMTPREYRNS